MTDRMDGAFNDSGFQVSVDAPTSYHEVAARFMVPFAVSLVNEGVRPGDSVLDVAAGTGFAARAAAKVVGPNGRVVGSDINESMVAHAAAISEAERDAISWDRASALDLPYTDGEFDCVISQQGVQFFPDIPAGLAEMARVTKPGGTIRATVWSALADTPYFEAMHQMLQAFCGVPETELAWWADASEIEVWFDAAGLPDVRVTKVEHVVTLPPIAEFVPIHIAATPWGPAFAQLDSEKTADAVRFMVDAVSHPELGAVPVDTAFVSLLASTKL